MTGLLRPLGSRPKSIMMVSSSSRGSSIVFTIRADGRLRVEPAQQRLQQRRLAGADLAGDDDEAGVALDAVAQVVQRLPVDAARVEVVRIRTERERTLAQFVESFVHVRGLPPPSLPRHAPSLPLAERGDRRAKAFRVMADLARRVFRNERYADRLGRPASRARSTRTCRSQSGTNACAAYAAPQMLGDRAGVVDDVVEQLRVQGGAQSSAGVRARCNRRSRPARSSGSRRAPARRPTAGSPPLPAGRAAAAGCSCTDCRARRR